MKHINDNKANFEFTMLNGKEGECNTIAELEKETGGCFPGALEKWANDVNSAETFNSTYIIVHKNRSHNKTKF